VNPRRLFPPAYSRQSGQNFWNEVGQNFWNPQESNLARKAPVRPIFTACAARYVEQSRAKRSIDVIK
jgi:hypothetical protein